MAGIPLRQSFKYLGVIFDIRLHIEIIEGRAFKTFIRIYSLFKSELINANIKQTLHKALIRSVMTYVCPVWELAAVTYHLKLQRLQNKVGSYPRCTPVRILHTAFRLPYV
jgi:hypothetical protein